MIRFRPLPLMSLIAIAALAFLMFIGRIEFDNYRFKTAADHVPFSEATVANYEPLPEGVSLVFGVVNGQQGWRVFEPVRTGDQTVFIDCDFIPSTANMNWREVRPPASLRFGTPIRGASIQAGSSPGPLAPPPHPLDRLWFSIDLPAMGRAAGLTNVADSYIAAAYIGPDGRAIPNPFAHQDRTALADCHHQGNTVTCRYLRLPAGQYLGYAVTWWGLAVVLVVIYFAYHMSVGRLKFAARARD